jgi:2-polyprenyl-3-methyl-5-hydroxy-6-metoxy-1,4-benzoquinol methylase
VIVDALAARIGSLSGQRVLDYGAGIGTITGYLVEAGAEVVAVELHPQGRNRISTRFDIPVVADLDEVRALDDRRPFDVVVMVEVVEHLRNPRADLGQLRGFLRDGGHLFLTTPNVASLKSRFHGRRWSNVAEMTHLVYFDGRSLDLTLQVAGFTQVERLKGASVDPDARLPRRLLRQVLHRLNLDGGLQVVALRGDDGSA